MSRDRRGAPPLADLLAQNLATAAAEPAPDLVDVLTVAVGGTVGLHRTTLLPMENFGIGQHPSNGLLRANDFSFAFEVVAPT